MFEGILKFHKNKIEVCKNQESSHFFIPIPSEMCDPCKLCNLQRQQTIALILRMDIFAVSGIFRMRHRLTRIPKVHSILILTCE